MSQGCLLLVKSLYGTKQGGHQWHKLLKKTLIELGFNCLSSEESVYIRDNITIAVYVDDILVACETEEEFKTFKAELNSKFKVGKAGKADHLLGIRISQTGDGITMDQETYVEAILEEYWDQKTKYRTPMSTTKLEDQTIKIEDPTIRADYLRLLGKIMYLAHCTRPDLAYTFSKLSRYTHNFGKDHWEALIRVVGYLAETKSWKLKYAEGINELEVYTDADWNVKTTAGYILMLKIKGTEPESAPICWKAWVLKSAALNTMEAEYHALAGGVKELRWVVMFMEELERMKVKKGGVICYVDNSACIELAGKPKFREKAKHIDIRKNFIRESMDEGLINITKISTHYNTSDILTKSLAKDKHLLHSSSLLVLSASGDVMDKPNNYHWRIGRCDE